MGKASKLFYVWHSMKKRCELTTYFQYKRYGGRGIELCLDWHDFQSFKKWATDNGYKEGLSIDRIDNDGNYEPKNCRWITLQEQNYNKSTSRYLTLDGKTKTVAEWSKEVGLSSGCIRYRLGAGWSTESALTAPLRR